MSESFEHILRQGESISSGDIRALAQWWESIKTERERKDAEIASLRTRKIAIVGGCECGIGYIDPPDSIDSGATFRCEAGHPIVFDVMTPEHRAARIGDGVTVERKMKKARDEKVPQ